MTTTAEARYTEATAASQASIDAGASRAERWAAASVEMRAAEAWFAADPGADTAMTAEARQWEVAYEAAHPAPPSAELKAEPG